MFFYLITFSDVSIHDQSLMSFPVSTDFCFDRKNVKNNLQECFLETLLTRLMTYEAAAFIFNV